MELRNPIPRIGNKEFAYRRGVGPVKVDRLTPLVLVTLGEVAVRELFHVVSVGTKVVIDDVKDDAHSQCVRSIDECAEFIWRSIQSRGGEHIHPVVTPSEIADEV